MSRRSSALGDVVEDVTPFLAAEQDNAEQERQQEADVLSQQARGAPPHRASSATVRFSLQARAQQAKAEVKQAMNQLEQISLEIASAKSG